MKIIGKPYSGKPNVRFDEGELEIEQSATTPALYSTVPFGADPLLPESEHPAIITGIQPFHPK